MRQKGRRIDARYDMQKGEKLAVCELHALCPLIQRGPMAGIACTTKSGDSGHKCGGLRLIWRIKVIKGVLPARPNAGFLTRLETNLAMAAHGLNRTCRHVTARLDFTLHDDLML
jgi:hypothetical protein